jgi:hypothetical protein
MNGANGSNGNTGPQGDTGPQGPQGPGFEFLGEWNDATTYNTGDVVKVTPAASSTYTPSVTYISLVDSNLDNYPPASPTEWAVLVTDGPEGPSGVTVVSDTAPVSPSSGNLWFKSDTGAMYVYYDSFWIEVGSPSSGLDGGSA